MNPTGKSKHIATQTRKSKHIATQTCKSKHIATQTQSITCIHVSIQSQTHKMKYPIDDIDLIYSNHPKSLVDNFTFTLNDPY